jgi:hypothetical protein
MQGVPVFGVFLSPVFYYIIESLFPSATAEPATADRVVKDVQLVQQH